MLTVSYSSLDEGLQFVYKTKKLTQKKLSHIHILDFVKALIRNWSFE